MLKQTLIAIMMASLMAGTAVADSKEADRSYKDAKRYLSKCKNNKTIISIGKLGFPEVRHYWENVPELKKVREEFEAADEALGDVLKNDPEYRAALEEHNRPDQSAKERLANWNKAKSSVFRRMGGNSEYKKARRMRDKALLECNLETFEYIIEDYRKQEKPFPIGKFTN